MSDNDPQIDLAEFRRALSCFATGVAVATTIDGEGVPAGITISSFNSVSLDPPLILWNVAKVSNSLEAYLVAKHFAINVLSSAQQDISAHFARSDHTLFDDIDYALSADGVPLLPGTIARFECRTHEIHDCGDHYIIIGAVERYGVDEGEPLLFYGGGYRNIGD